jgi:vacuolar-type H+-ATPase subunit E/Vma4
MVRAVIEKIAQATDEEPEELVEAATRDARWKAQRARQEAEKVERDLRNMSRERLLPDEKTLEKVARYEAHLSRLFHKSLHELEALQTSA